MHRKTPLTSSLISCLNSSSRGLANSWHSSITDSSQTIRFPPRPNTCLSWFCWIKKSKLLQLTLWAGAATYKTCSAHHNLSSLSHICAHLHVCVCAHAADVCTIHQHTRKFKISFTSYIITYVHMYLSRCT